jgi:hypothetical protein
MSKPTIRIFISSPGDVLYERQIAKRIIAKLGKEFAASVRLEALLWEDMPLQATTSFQEGIDQIANANLVDIAIFILWSRLGSPLSDKFKKPDGGYYKSGTEYEFEMMYAAHQLTGAPSILAYIKNAPIADAIFQSSSYANFDIEEIGKQHKEAQRFIREKFYDPETKTVYGAYHQFEAPTSFEQKLTEHLRRLIINKIGHEAIPIEWEGNPYVGLRSFRYDENAIFYGRRQAINAIEEKLARFLPDKAPCLFVLGESGSGKSSLVRAGLLPDMIEFGWVENTKWKWFDIMPSQFRGNVYNGLLSKLCEAFPILNEKSIGKDLMTGKEVNFDHLSDILPDNRDEAVLFFIDQFEEIFTDPLITEEERIRTFGLLRGIASTHKIWLIFSMRSDFYHRITGYPRLSELKNEGIVFDLPKILHSELQEIVEEPAKKAGLKWETNEQGISLNKTIIHDINKGVNDLPLIEFALSELYNLRNENNILTFKAYEDIGKIDGAVVKYVDNFYNTLTEKEQDCFYQILSALIAPSLENKNLYVRKTALLRDLQKTGLHEQLISNLINSHILISGKDENGEATVSIVHKILISSWKVIRDWIEQEKYFINANNHYENLSNYWIEHSKAKSDLLQGKTAIKESEYFLYTWENNSSENVRNFLLASVKKKKRKYLVWVIICLFIAGIIGIVGIVQAVQYKQNSELINEILYDLEISGGILNVILNYFAITILLIYLVWKKIKAVPNYRTVNVSLIVWPAVLMISIAVVYVSQWSNWLLFFLVLMKLIHTILQKRELLQWEKRIFSRDAIFLSIFPKNLSTLIQKTSKIKIWIIAIASIALLSISGYYAYTSIRRLIETGDTTNTNVRKRDEIKGNGKLITSEKSVSDFDKIKSTGIADVHFYVSEEYRVVVTIDENLSEFVEITSSDNELNIGIKNEINPKFTKFSVDVYCPALTGVTLLGGSFTGMDKIIASSFTATSIGTGRIEGTIECDNFTGSIINTGRITVAGTCTNAIIKLTGTGRFEGNEFEIMSAIVTSTGTGNANVYVKEFLNASAIGVGNINYRGNPKVEAKDGGVGKVRKQ